MTFWDRAAAIAVISILAALGYRILGGRNSHPLVTMAILSRYSWGAALSQCGLGLWALAGFPFWAAGRSLLTNVFLLDDPRQLCFVTWISLLLGTFVLVTSRTTKINAPFRFSDYGQAFNQYMTAPSSVTRETAVGHRLRHVLLNPQRSGKNFWRWRWAYLIVLAVPIPLAALRLTFADLRDAGMDPQTADLWKNLGLGVFLWVLTMLLTTFAQQLCLDGDLMDVGLFPFDWLRINRARRWRGLDRFTGWIARVINRLGPGFAEKRHGVLVLRPGHGQLGTFALILLFFYLCSFYSSEPPQPDGDFSTLFGLLTMMLVITLLSTGAAFLLDYFRIPLVLSAVVLAAAGWTLSDADSYYEFADVDASSDNTTADDAPPAAPAKTQHRTLVVVTAAGGGIQAAGWTAQVLTGLHELCGNGFTSSIKVASGVSGGSVGLLFFFDQWRDHPDGIEDNPATLNAIRKNAMGSSLEATAWGWSRWDTVKAIAPYLAPMLKDRGWAIERDWQSALVNPHATMGEWGKRARAGNFPVVVFNATGVEDGKRFMIANLPLAPSSKEIADDLGDEFHSRYPQKDINVVTAARLSATFPYVSPICRPLPTEGGLLHLADGGYADNGGFVSALQWSRQLLGDTPADAKTRAFDQVLLVRIVPFPPGREDQPWERLGWLVASLGPVEALANVRTASQSERNALDEQFLRERMESLQIPFHVAKFQFADVAPGEQPPLSWKLSHTEKKAIARAWESIVTEWRAKPADDSPLHGVTQWFPAK